MIEQALLEGIRSIAHGVGGTVEVLASRTERVTARVTAPDGGALAVKASTRMGAFDTELAARHTLRTAGLPVDGPVSYDPGPPSVLCLPWVDGEPLSPATARTTVRAVGALLRQVHSLPGSPPYAGNPTWTSWMRGWLDHAIPWWDEQDSGTAGVMSGLLNDLRDLESDMEAECRSQILFDGRPEHFLVNGDDVRMIDVEELRAGDPAMDFAVLAMWEPALLPDILHGYASPDAGVGSGLLRRTRFYTTLRLLAAAEWHTNEVPDIRLRELFMRRAALTVHRGSVTD